MCNSLIPLCVLFSVVVFFGAVIVWQASVCNVLHGNSVAGLHDKISKQHSIAQHNTAHNVFHLSPNRNQPTWIVNSMKITLLDGFTESHLVKIVVKHHLYFGI